MHDEHAGTGGGTTTTGGGTVPASFASTGAPTLASFGASEPASSTGAALAASSSESGPTSPELEDDDVDELEEEVVDGGVELPGTDWAASIPSVPSAVVTRSVGSWKSRIVAHAAVEPTSTRGSKNRLTGPGTAGESEP